MALNISILRQSWCTAIARQPNLAGRFLDILVSRHPEARAVITRTPREVLERMLTSGLAEVIAHLEDRSWLEMRVAARDRRLRQLHGVSYELYGWAGECMLAVLAEASGRAWSPDIGRAWAEAFGSVMDIIVMSRVTRRSEPQVYLFRPRSVASTAA